MTLDSVVCLACGSGELRPDPFLVRCSGCDYVLSRDLFLLLRRIRELPETETARRGGTERSARDEGGR